MSRVPKSGPFRRLAKLAYWTLSFQLRARLRERRQAQELRRSALFDAAFYLTSYPDIAVAAIDPVLHYVCHGAREGRDPHPLFDTRFYLAQNPDVAASGICPLLHFLRHGATEGADPNPLFDTSFYLETNPFVAASGLNPLVHYVEVGAAAGRDPGPGFRTEWYLESHPELVEQGTNPLAHYLRCGAQQGFAPLPPSAPPAPAEPTSRSGARAEERGSARIRLVHGPRGGARSVG